MPALHISLGVYLKFFNLLEYHCRLLDFKIIAQSSTDQEILQVFNCIVELERQVRRFEELIELAEEGMAIELAKKDSNEAFITAAYKPRIDLFHGKIVEKV